MNSTANIEGSIPLIRVDTEVEEESGKLFVKHHYTISFNDFGVAILNKSDIDNESFYGNIYYTINKSLYFFT